jgi:hypothetical protein
MAVVYPYVVTLKNQNTRYIDILGFLLLLVSLFYFVKEMIVAGNISFAYLAGSVFIASVLIWNIYSGLIKKKKVFFKYGLFIAALVWMKMPDYQWLAFPFIVLALLEYHAKYAVEIGFSEKEILINSLFKKRVHWSQLSNVVLKDGILTIDFNNNKIIQKEVEDDEEDDADEEEFNQYCREQLARRPAA